MTRTIYCPGCDGRGEVQMRRDPFAPMFVCPDCDGDKLARCEVGNCREYADDTAIIGTVSVPMCETHLEAWKADADADANE